MGLYFVYFVLGFFWIFFFVVLGISVNCNKRSLMIRGVLVLFLFCNFFGIFLRIVIVSDCVKGNVLFLVLGLFFIEIILCFFRFVDG